MIKKITYSILTALLLVLVVIYFLYSNFRSARLAALERNSQIVHTTAGPVEYQFVGNSGQVVLLLHGTPGGYDQTTEIEGFRVLTPSRPGYLRTPLDAGRSPAEQARVYIALLDSLDIDNVIVMGASNRQDLIDPADRHGTADVNVPYIQSQRLAEQIPHATLHTIDDADHMMPFSHSEDVAAAVDTFITTLNL